MDNLPTYSQDYNLELARKVFFLNKATLDFTGRFIINENDDMKIVMFRSSGYEEEYTIYAEHDKWIKVDEQRFEFSDKWDNYKIVIVDYSDAELMLGDKNNPMYDQPDPFTRQVCSICGNGGCPSCMPHWFI